MMIGTILSIILAVFLWFNPHAGEISELISKTLMIATAMGLLFLFFLGWMLSWLPLQKAEQNSAPRVLEMFHKDKRIFFISSWLIFFALVTFVLANDKILPSISQHPLLFPVWIVLLGISIDALLHFLRRIMSYVNPFSVVKIFENQAMNDIRNNHELDLCDSIDALSEMAIKGVERHSTSICQVALGEEQEIMKQFLLASKSIAHVSQDAQLKQAGIVDKVSFTLFYLFQRLDIVFDKALKNKLEPICSYIVTLLGKIAIDAAKYDVSLASAPLRFIGKCGKRAQDQGYEETGITASCVLLEVARAMISEIDLTYYEIKDPFLSIINGLEVMSKDTFKRDKTTNVTLLMQPFKDLRTMFESDRVKNHQDTPVILQNINRVLGEYEALQVVLTTIPPIPPVEDALENKG
jgi:hypothetical protein